MNRTMGVSPDDMTKLVMAYVQAARMYNRIVWQERKAIRTQAREDRGYVCMMMQKRGEEMGRAKWWRQQLKEVYGI